MAHYDDLIELADSVGAIKRQDPEAEATPILFVAPLGISIAEDGQLAYVTVDTFSDILKAEPGSVVLIREDQTRMLSVLAKDADLFGVELRALYGVPGSQYERWFEEAVFGVEKVSYAPLVSELRVAREIAAAKKANVKTVVEKEEKQYVRADGSVRYDDAIGVASEEEDDV